MELKNNSYHKDHDVIQKKVVGFDALWCNNCESIVSYIKPITKSNKARKKKINIETRTIFDTNIVVHNKDLIIENNTIYNEKEEITISRIPDNHIDCVITSPPYNIGNNLTIDNNTKYERLKYNDYNDSLSQEDYLNWQIKVIKSLLRITKKHIFYNTQILSGNKIAILTILEHFKHNIKDIVIWVKRTAPPLIVPKGLNSKFELVIIFSNDRPEVKTFSDASFTQGSLNNVIEISKKTRQYSEINKATFPIDFPRWVLLNFGKEGELIYDPYMGSGTTAVACITEKRNYIGSEISKDQVDNANKRLLNTNQIKIF